MRGGCKLAKKWVGRTLSGLIITLIITIGFSVISNSINGDLLPYLDYLYDFSSSKLGLIIFLGLPGVYLVIIQLWKLLRLLTQAEELNSDNRRI
jgi:TRAP-type mannitol/chloroaromatic compound transport system permease small subunit